MSNENLEYLSEKQIFLKKKPSYRRNEVEVGPIDLSTLHKNNIYIGKKLLE